jgi:hypothetical protein
LSLTSPTSGGRSVGIVRWRTKAPEFDSSDETNRETFFKRSFASRRFYISVVFHFYSVSSAAVFGFTHTHLRHLIYALIENSMASTYLLGAGLQ